MSNIEMTDGGSDTLHKKYGGAPIVFLQEKSLFGERKPSQSEWLKHTELYEALSNVIDSSHLTGLQRVNGFWRIYLDNLEDKVLLMSEGVTLRGKSISVLNTNPNRLDGEQSTKIKIKNVPLSVEDGVIARALTLKGLEIISYSRIKLRINGRLTNCETGDRVFIAKTSTLKDPLPRYMSFGNFTGRVIHDGQESARQGHSITCRKCLEQGHAFSECKNDWKCIDCKQFGHKRGQCQVTETPHPDPHTNTQSVNTSEHENSEPPKENQSEAKPKRVRKKRDKKVISGQKCIDSFCKTDLKHSTPNKGKPSVAFERSPPTPAEELNEQSKKNRPNIDSSGDSADDSESDN